MSTQFFGHIIDGVEVEVFPTSAAMPVRSRPMA